MGCMAMQKGPLWWAAHHRHHHQHSDEREDIHSPKQRGLWWAHLGWVLSDQYNETRYEAIRDFAKYPELRWLNRNSTAPGVALAALCLIAGGTPGLIWGFFVSTVLLYHGTFAINSLCHVFGTVRYHTRDTSRNNLALAIVALGEGWHNNHHHYATSARMGFFWWEIDVSYYLLRVLSLAGLVWDLKQPSERALRSL
jgi:stearoyl-CoA desaturase (delta-9 desaturase)